MAIDFLSDDVIHNLVVRFVNAFLPGARKPYNLKAEFQPELDVHGVAAKADVYKIGTDSRVIEDGVNAFIELVYYLVADGYKIKTPLFNLKMRIPGEYTGDETRLAEGVYPEARLQASAAFREYLKKTVRLEFAGILEDFGHIGEVFDESSEDLDESATIGNILAIRGHGLKISADESHKLETGVYFQGPDEKRIKCALVPVNQPRLLKVIVPSSLVPGTPYAIVIITQSSIHNNGHILKNPRTIRSDFTLKTLPPTVLA
jgi:hypothetical protein